MMTKGSPEKVDQQIKPTDWYLLDVTPTEIDGLKYSGRLTLIKRPGGQREIHDWAAVYALPGNWVITGRGAKMPSGDRVPSKDKFPFVLDPIVNSGIVGLLKKWLDGHKSDRSLLPGKNGDIAAHNGHVQAPPVPIVQKAPEAVVPAMLPPKPEAGEGEKWVPIEDVIVFQPNVDDPRFSGQPRKFFDPVALLKLGESIKEYEQQQAVKVVPYDGPAQGKKWELVDGERRYRAAMSMGLSWIKVIVGKRVPKRLQHLQSLIQNFCREGHTLCETSDALQEQIDAGETVESLAKAIGMKAPDVSKYLSLQRLHKSLRPLLDPPTPPEERIKFGEALTLSRIPVELQNDKWREARNAGHRRLVAAKLKMICKDHVINPRRPKASLSARSMERRVTTMHVALTELCLTGDDVLDGIKKAKGQEFVDGLITRLEAIMNGLSELKARLA